MKSTLQMKQTKTDLKPNTQTKKISVRRTGDIRLTTASICGHCYCVQV